MLLLVGGLNLRGSWLGKAKLWRWLTLAIVTKLLLLTWLLAALRRNEAEGLAVLLKLLLLLLLLDFQLEGLLLLRRHTRLLADVAALHLHTVKNLHVKAL